MGVGNNGPGELLTPLGDKTQIRHLHRWPERPGHLLQGDPTVHCNPLVLMAKEIAVHADLTAPPQGQENYVATARFAHSKSVYQV